MTSPQRVTPGPNPPQLDSLTADTDIVTIGIGGNDIGFSSIIQDCVRVFFWVPVCQPKYVVNGVDALSNRIAATAPRVASVLQGIHSRSPRARVFVVGYPAILPETGGGCWPSLPHANDDVPWLRDKEKELNAMLATQAAANGASYVDTYSPTRVSISRAFSSADFSFMRRWTMGPRTRLSRIVAHGKSAPF